MTHVPNWPIMPNRQTLPNQPILPNWPILPILPNRFHLNHYSLNHKLPTVHYMGFHLVFVTFSGTSIYDVCAKGGRG